MSPSQGEPENRRPFLQIENVSKSFGPFVALRDISLNIYEGEFICFLGPSGCGKTTLLRAVAGLDIQTTGSVEQAGRDISALPPSERDFGIVFQSYALFPNLTVAKNIAYGLENRRMPRERIRARVSELLELVGLPEQSDKYPAQLSGGQQQRIALARAIATSPGLLLLDEPLSALDAKVRVHLRHEIKHLQRRLGVTTIMVTHDQEEALTMADRIVVMNHGVIDQVGTPLDIYSHPRSAFVAEFIGTMNFLPAAVTTEGKVSLGVQEIDCSTEDMAPGTQVTLAVRPEDVRLAGSEGGNNSFDASVSEIEFLGAFYRADLALPDASGISMQADFSSALVKRAELESGSKVRLTIPSETIRIYPGRSD